MMSEPTRTENEQKTLPVLPVRATVLLPRALLPLPVGRESSIQLVNSLGDDKTIIVVAQREVLIEAPKPPDLYAVGTTAVVRKVVKMPTKVLFAFAEGLERVRLGEFTQLAPFMRAHYSSMSEGAPPIATSEVEALRQNVLILFKQVVAGSQELSAGSEELSSVAVGIEEPGRLADFISSLPLLSVQERQDILETLDIRLRLEKIHRYLVARRRRGRA